MVGSKSKPSIRLAVCLIQAIVVGSKNTTLREKNLRGAPRAAQRINKRHVSTAGKQAKVPAATRAHPYHNPPPPTLAFYRDGKNTVTRWRNRGEYEPTPNHGVARQYLCLLNNLRSYGKTLTRRGRQFLWRLSRES